MHIIYPPASHLPSQNCLRNLRGVAVMLILVLGIASTLAAQAFRLKRYNEDAGLAEGYIYTIVQDGKGFLYLGTGAGLYRFDGGKFKAFKQANGLAQDFTTASFRDSKQRVWLGHYEGQVSLLQDMAIRPLQDSNVIKAAICGFAEDKQGNIWCASQEGIHLLETAGVVKSFTAGLDGRNIYSFSIAKAGTQEYCLVGTDQGLLVYRPSGKKMEFLYASSKVPATRIQCIAKLPTRSGFLIGTEDAGLIEYVPDTRDTTAIMSAYNATTGYPLLDNVQSLLIDNGRDLWIGTAGNGFLKYRDNGSGLLTPISPALRSDSTGQDNIRAIYQDRFGQVWMGTYGKGLLCMTDEVFTTYRMRNDSASKMQVLCSIEDRKGDFWVGTNRGLYLIDRNTVASSNGQYTLSGMLRLLAKRKYTTADGLPADEITCLMQDASQDIWVGTRNHGVAILHNGEERFVPKSFSDISLSNNINAIVQDKQGNVWIATTDGAFSYNPSSGKTNYYGTQNKLPHNNIYNIFCDVDGGVWLATHTNYITLYDGKSFENFEVSEHGEISTVTCINQTKDKVIWLGTDGAGLYRYDRKSFQQFTKLDGLQSNYVYQIIVDHYDNVWTTHRDGFSRWIHDTDHIISYPAKEYFPNPENPVTGANIDAFGNIWFCSEHGWIKYNWNPTRNKTTPPAIFINALEIGDSSWDIHSDIDLAYGSYNFKFGFLGLTFLNQEDVLYQYKLEGREQDWSAPTKQDFVTFQSLADGEYTFHVRACNVYGKCNESSARISFRIAPPFWKTWWFIALMALVFAGAIYAYIRYRIYRLNKEKAELEEKVKQRTIELQAEKEKVDLANIELEKLSLVASETDNAVFILDPKGDLTWVNAGFSRLTGFSIEDLLELRNGGRNFLDTSSDSRVNERLREAIRENKSVQYESQLPSKSGDTIWVISTLTPILDKAGKLRNIVIIDSNITDRKVAEEKIRQMNAELESQVAARTRELAESNESLQHENEEHIKTAAQLTRINSELDTFVYRASHDLKGPLASLIGLINIAGMELSDNAVAVRYLGLMDKASKRLDVILIDLIEATQVKQRVVEKTDINAAQLATTVCDVVRQQVDMTNAEIVIDIDPNLMLNTDEPLFTAILQNYLGNALKYKDKAKEKAIATLSIKAYERHLLVSVTDNGIGMPEDMQHRVFDMFYRGSHATGGSGLGLYIVKQAAEKLGGSVSLQSNLGEGTTMFAKIPL
jgi:PAS domain S-box-containing protein